MTKSEILTWIYLMRDRSTGFYKIGKSNDPTRRLKDLCRQDTKQPVPNDFELIEAWWSAEVDERNLHSKFSDCRCRGEWFALSPTDVTNLYRYFLGHQPYSSKVRSRSDQGLIDVSQDNVRLRGQLKCMDGREATIRSQAMSIQSTLLAKLIVAEERAKAAETRSLPPGVSRLSFWPSLKDRKV